MFTRLAAGALMLAVTSFGFAHQIKNAEVTYLGNEALLVESGEHKLLFDPFFHKDFNQYQLVPEQVQKKIMSNHAPYNDIDAIFISHAHDDHFAADLMVKYLNLYPGVKLIAPEQAINKVRALVSDQLDRQLTSLKLAFGQQAVSIQVEGLEIGAVRIPHAGWPGRKDIENLLFRVTTADQTTVMHMGDADPNDDHYLPYKPFWQSKTTDMAFPPFWFFYSAEGRDILSDILNIKESVGVHVPVIVPKRLKQSSHKYFSKPAQKMTISN